MREICEVAACLALLFAPLFLFSMCVIAGMASPEAEDDKIAREIDEQTERLEAIRTGPLSMRKL